LQQSLLPMKQGRKPTPGQVMVLPTGNDIRQITQSTDSSTMKEQQNGYCIGYHLNLCWGVKKGLHSFEM
jgi:hypothetical protein